ncbi:MAG: hypothetical protein KAJ23_14915 [Maribacter sp.]|nr:hypothetical protein [Maribacter sp.]
MKNILLLLLLASSFAYTQTIGNGDGIKTDTQAGLVFREVPIEGTPFVDNIYKKGETIINGKVQSTVLMRYNAFHDYVEILNENSQPRRLLRRANIIAVFGGNTYEIMRYKEAGKVRLAYFNSLNIGNTILCFRPKKKFIQAEKPDHGYDDYDPPIYRDVSSYYIKHGNLAAEVVKLSKRSLLKALSDKSSELNVFIQNKKLNIKSKEDAIMLIEYYNSLQTSKMLKKKASS